MAGVEEASVVVVLVADTLAAAEEEASMEGVSAVAVSAAVPAILVRCLLEAGSLVAEWAHGVASAGVPTIGTAAIGVVIGIIIMMSSSSATWAFRGGGAGTIRTDITVTTITPTIPMGTAGMDTVGTVTTITPVTDTAMAADQGICAVREIGDKRGLRCG
jgi:hypothetical protein